MSVTASSERTRFWTALRSQFRATREALTAHQTLERELASYTSESDLDDLYAMLDRYSDRDTAHIRRILATRQA